MSAVEILTPGPLTTLQDHGRPGYSTMGVGWSGAVDLDAHDAANRLVGNVIEAATLEATLGGLRIRAHGTVVLAVTGAPSPVSINGIADGRECTLVLHEGDELHLGTPDSGLRSYLAVRGGFDVAPVLSSRSTDTMSGIGPEPMAPGTMLAVGDDRTAWPATDCAPQPMRTGALRVVLGPRDDWFRDPSALLTNEWTVTSDVDRIGIRLDGPRSLERTNSSELPSEGMVFGALQVPPDGKPVVFLADHPVTGGYPVIGVVHSQDLSRLGQLRPGDTVRFSL